MRTFVAVILGYVVTALTVYGALAAAWNAMGPDRALIPGRWQASDAWILSSLVLGLLAAMLGGFVAAWLGRGMRAPRVLALVLLALGVAMAIPTLGQPPSEEPRLDGPVPMTVAMQHTTTPSWLAFGSAIVGAGGVLLGARRRFGPDHVEGPREVPGAGARR